MHQPVKFEDDSSPGLDDLPAMIGGSDQGSFAAAEKSTKHHNPV
jgi:hypothetical protein